MSLSILTSCVLHKAYVPATFEPVVVSEKKQIQGSVTLRPLDYLNLDATYMFTKHLSVKTSLGGTVGLFNGTVGILYLSNFSNSGFYFGPLYNFQSNKMRRRIYGISGYNYDYTTKYNCSFNSFGGVIGYNIKGRIVQHHIIIKSQYSLVDKYNFEFYSDNASGKSSGFVVFDDEKLNKTIPSFFSVEPSYAILFKAGKKGFMKLQGSLNICEKTYTHNYVYYDYGYSGNNVEAIKGIQELGP